MLVKSKQETALNHSTRSGSVVFALLCVFWGTAVAQSDDYPPVQLPGTESHVIKTEKIPQALRLFVSLPFNYSTTTDNYPVVYVTDGHNLFPMLFGAMRLLDAPARNVAGKTEVPSAILVGITYDDDLQKPASKNSLSWRIRDFTPPMDPAYIEAYTQHRARNGTPMLSGVTPGGADNFQAIIEDEIKPFINAHYRVDSSDETYVGYSQGGLFGIYLLFQHTDTFDRYVIGSPSLWWGNGVAFNLEAEYAKRNSTLSKNVFLSVGADENNVEPANMISNVQKMLERLESRQYPSLQLTGTILEGENHLSGISTSLSKGLRAVFEPQAPYKQGKKGQ